MNSYSGDGVSEAGAELLLTVAKVALVVTVIGLGLAVIALVACGVLVWDVLKVQPRNRPVWISLGAFAACLLLVLLSSGAPLTVALWLVSFLGVMLTAYAVKVSRPELFQRQEHEQSGLAEMIRRPWWPHQQHSNTDRNEDAA